jgi:hypothetical protein
MALDIRFIRWVPIKQTRPVTLQITRQASIIREFDFSQCNFLVLFSPRWSAPYIQPSMHKWNDGLDRVYGEVQ